MQRALSTLGKKASADSVDGVPMAPLSPNFSTPTKGSGLRGLKASSSEADDWAET